MLCYLNGKSRSSYKKFRNQRAINKTNFLQLNQINKSIKKFIEKKAEKIAVLENRTKELGQKFKNSILIGSTKSTLAEYNRQQVYNN